MANRLRILGFALGIGGMVFVGLGGFAWFKIQQGYDSLAAFSGEQNVTLSYNEDGQLTDRGTVEGAQAIMTLLTEDWGYPITDGHFDPDDPVVNTASEYMYQMATIGYHVLHGEQTVVLTEDVEYEGQLFTAGEYVFPVDGRYWTDFDRRHPIEGPARSQAWSGTVHGLFGELGVGVVTASTLQLGLGFAGSVLGIGLMFMLGGFGLVWATGGRKKEPVFPEIAQERIPEKTSV